MRALLTLFLSGICIWLSAQTTDTEPILRLDLPMHDASIRNIDTDQQGRYLLTASFDKTAKLWDIATGKLIRTFRPPIGIENIGKLNAAAISPDGNTVAIGGYSQKKEHAIYIFDVTSGQMINWVPGQEGVILDLEYSSDGRYLAASRGKGSGIQVYRSSTYTEVFADRNYDNDTYGIAFDKSGRLATACIDGYIRLYDQNFKLLKQLKTSVGNWPFSLSFSPDGAHLAVGYEDSPVVQVLNAYDLSLEFTPDNTEADVRHNHLIHVAYSTDGAYLLAGGYYRKNIPIFRNNVLQGNLQFQIRKWSEAGRGSYTDITAGENTISCIKPIPGNQLVFSSHLPDWGVIDLTSNQRSLFQTTEVNLFLTTNIQHLRLSADGFELGFTPLDNSPVTFYLSSRDLQSKQSTQPSYTDQTENIRITDWKDSATPKLNGKLLTFLDDIEYCKCVDIGPDQDRILFGTGRTLYCLDKSEQVIWKRSESAQPWAVNIAGNGQVAAATFGDGTIRWYRMSDGQLLLTFFLHSDLQRWILWTPSGYYDAAPGAESMLGWHVNHGPDHEALFYPVSQFRDKYYRPDVIDRILETLDEDEAVRLADQVNAWRQSPDTRTIVSELPPTVHIESPASGTSTSNNTIKIAYSIESPNNENITGVSILVDTRPVSRERGLKPAGLRGEATITIPRQDCIVSIIAENRFGVSAAATIHLKWSGVKPADLSKPKLYLLAIGVSKYDNKDYELNFAAKDAKDFAGSIAGQKGLLYRDISAKILTDGDATKDNILDGLEWLQRETTRRDVAMIFFAGHGIDDNAQNFYFLPVNADMERLKRTGILKTDIQATVRSIAGKVIVFMDACQSGGLMKQLGRRGTPDISRIVNELISAENGAVVFSSATSRQYALEDVRWNNGAFTKALVEGLSGAANFHGDGKITVKTLDAYIAERVKELTNGQQSPTTNFPPDVEDFPIAIKE